MLNLINFLNRLHTMKVVTYSHARNALKSVLDTVVRDADVAIISRRDAGGDAVVMSLDHYNSLMETLHLLSTPANAEALARAIRQDRAGEAQPRTLIDADGA
jgi:antitoxin YefM